MKAEAFVKPDQREQFTRQQLVPLAYALPLKLRRTAIDIHAKYTKANLEAKTKGMLKQ